MSGVTSQWVNRLRLFILAVVSCACCLSTAHAMRPPTAAESQLMTANVQPRPSLVYRVFVSNGEVRTGLFVANNPINEIDPLGLWWWDGDYIQWGVGGLLGFHGGDVASEAWSGFGEGWSKGGQGVINDFSGGLFDNQSGALYNYFDQLDEGAFGSGIKCDSAFKFGSKAGNFAITTLSLAAGPSARVAAARQGLFKVGTTIVGRDAAYRPLIGTKQARFAGRYYSELIARNTFDNGAPATADSIYDFFTTIKYSAGGSEAAINWITGTLTHFIP